MALPSQILVTANLPFVTWEESNFAAWSVRPDAHTATRHAQVDGAQVNDFMAAMLGYSVFNSATSTLARYPPEPHPSLTWMVAREVEFVRELGVPTDGGTDDSLLYPNVELAVNYERPEGNVGWFGDADMPPAATDESWRYVRFAQQFSLAARIIPRGQLLFTANPGPGQFPVPEPGVAMEVTSTITLQWLQIPTVVAKGIPLLPGSLEGNIAAVQGRVNNATFLGLYPPRTLFCMAPKLEIKPMANGLPAWDITYQLERRGATDTTGVANGTGSEDAAWDRIRLTDGLFYRVYRKPIPPAAADQSVSIFREADFTKLFKFA